MRARKLLILLCLGTVLKLCPGAPIEGDWKDIPNDSNLMEKLMKAVKAYAAVNSARKALPVTATAPAPTHSPQRGVSATLIVGLTISALVLLCGIKLCCRWVKVSDHAQLEVIPELRDKKTQIGDTNVPIRSLSLNTPE